MNIKTKTLKILALLSKNDKYYDMHRKDMLEEYYSKSDIIPDDYDIRIDNKWALEYVIIITKVKMLLGDRIM